MATQNTEADGANWESVQAAALIVGAAFLLVGSLSFLPGVTMNYDALQFAGHESGAKLLGVFQVSILHNIVLLAFGVVGVVMAQSVKRARTYLLVGGLIFAVLWMYGLMIDLNTAANFLPVNTADNWMHLVVSVGMFGLGLVLGRASRSRRLHSAGRRPGTAH